MKDILKVLKTFYRYQTKKKGWFALFLVFLVVTGIVNSILPYFYKLFVEGLIDFNYTYLVTILIYYVVARIAGLVLQGITFLIGDKVLFTSAMDVRMDVFNRLQDLDFAFHSNKSTGSLISRMKRGDGAFYSLNFALHYRIAEVVIGFLVMIYFFNELDPVITLLVISAFVTTLLIARFVVMYNIKMRKLFNREEDKISGVIVDNIINFETVKLFAKEKWERNRLTSLFDVWLKRLWNYGNSFRVFDLTVGTIINVSIFFILYFGLKRTANDALTPAEFILVVGFINSVFPKLFDLVFAFRDIAKNYEDIRKYFSILDYKVEIKDPPKSKKIKNIKGEIEFKNVVFSYKDGKKNAINDVSIAIRQGQSIALVGRSGSGKTTLTKLLMRFYDVDSGSIAVDQTNIKKVSKSHLRSFMGVVPQEPVMFNNTIGYNIGYGASNATQKEIEAAAQMANLHEFIESLPEKYETDVGERGIKLSGGQKQRLAIARMILSDPEIVIFDEATSQLDSENETLIQEAFWKATKNKTTIIIAHRLSTAKRADKIVVMENGKIAEEGSHKSLLTKKNGMYKHFWDLQTSE